MRAVPISEFKDRVSDYLSAAEGGEEILITRDGQPALRLVLEKGEDAESQEDRFERQRLALDRILETREALRAQGVRIIREEIREWIAEGRR